MGKLTHLVTCYPKFSRVDILFGHVLFSNS